MRRLSVVTLLILSCIPAMSFAEEPPASPAAVVSAPQNTTVIPRDRLMRLGRQFLSKVGERLQEADLFLAGAGKLKLAEHKSRTQILDDEPLIFHATAGKSRVYLGQDIYAVKRGERMMVSFGDFCSAADFAISVRTEEGRAEGWFIREDQQFFLDVKKGEVSVLGKTSSIDPADIDASPDDILISAALLEKWFDLDFSYNFASLSLAIASAQTVPAAEAYLRGKRRKPRGSSDKDDVTLPLEKTPYAIAALPYVDANIISSWKKSPGGEPVKSTNWSTVFTGDLAGFNTQAYTTGASTAEGIDYLTSARVTMGREDIEGGLLGPLHATAYQFGDVNSVPLSLIDGGGQELGARFTNKPADVTTDTATEVRGDSQPGWDVELYRNESYIDIRRVDIEGQYVFEKVDLIAGNNDLKLLFYGPQGEIREEHRHILVDPYQLARNRSYYTVSATRSQMSVWDPVPPTGPGVGDPHLAALYEYGIPGLGTANLGVRNRSDAGVNRTFVQGGVATSLSETFLNANAGYDIDGSNATAVLSARRTFGMQAGLLQYSWASQDYNISSALGNSSAATKDTLRAGLSGPLPVRFTFFDHLNYNLNGSHTNRYDGQFSENISSSLSARLHSITLSSGLNYSRSSSSPDAASASFNGRGFLFGGNWRVGTNYQVKPQWQMTDATVEYNYYVSDTIDLQGSIDYIPNPEFYTVNAGMSWQAGKASIGPTVQWDTADNVALGLNVHFGLGADPYSKRYHMYGKYMSASGGVAALVFLDKNGDGLFSDDDEPMPDVVLKARQNRVSAISNTKGVAFIPNLPESVLTDVTVDQTSFMDSYNVSLFKGVSVSPRSGVVTKLEFPVVVSGEIDGQADLINEEGGAKPARGAKISLIAPDGTVEKSASAAFDGYYSISQVSPGMYYLVTSTFDRGYKVPVLMEFKPDGSTYFGNAIQLKHGHKVNFIFRSVNPPPSGEKRTRVIRPEDLASKEVLIHLGQYRSRLTMMLAWYRFKVTSKIWGGYTLVTPLADITPDPKTAFMTIVLKPIRPLGLDEAAAACQVLQEKKFQCAVEVVTTYSAPANGVAEEASKTASKT